MAIINIHNIYNRWPHGNQHIPGLMDGIIASQEAVYKKHGINPTPLLLAHMFGQFSEECGQGLEMEENGNYSAARLLQVFPTHFTQSMASRAAHHPRLVFDIAYGGRMGNRPYPSDDGYNFRGRGLSQTTGREGYTKLAEKTGLDLLSHPELLSDPEFALECGVADYLLCGCLPYGMRDDTVNETRHLNGGLNGLADRRAQIAAWKRELKVGVSVPTVRRGRKRKVA